MTALRSPRHRHDGIHTQSGSISIAAAPATVWELITTVDTIPEWYDTWDTVEYDAPDPRLQVGTSFQLTRHRPGRLDDTARCRVIDLTAPNRLRWEQSSPHHPTMSVGFLLIAGTTVGTTQVQHIRTWRTR